MDQDTPPRATQGIPNRELRQVAVEGIRLQLANADRLVTVKVKKDGSLVAGAHAVKLLIVTETTRGSARRQLAAIGWRSRAEKHNVPLALKAIKSPPQPAAFNALAHGFDGECHHGEIRGLPPNMSSST